MQHYKFSTAMTDIVYSVQAPRLAEKQQGIQSDYNVYRKKRKEVNSLMKIPFSVSDCLLAVFFRL